MKDYLLDIVQHTHGLGGIDLAKITGDESSTKLNSISEDRTSVVIEGEFKNAIPDFVGTFGLPNLARLHTLLGLPVYKEDALLSITRNNDEPSSLHFENKEGDFQNDYRFMGESVVSSILKNFKFKDVTWNIDIVPTVTSIQRLKFMAQAHPDETTFSAKTEDSKLKFYFGDPSSHSGEFVFEQGVSGTLKTNWSWPINYVNSILSLPGDKTLKISDEGASMITVDSGLIAYNYILPAQTK
jgi:hypothetical protein